jgi:hypothetical protein
MKADLERQLKESIQAAWIKRAGGGDFKIADVVADLVVGSDLWKEHREQILTAWLTPKVHRSVQRFIGLPASSQLSLPGFEVPQLIMAGSTVVPIETATLRQLREFEEWYKSRIGSYKYGRRSKEQAKQDRKTLRELRRLDRAVSRYAGGDQEMMIGAGLQRYQKDLGDRAPEVRRRVASKAIRARGDRAK